jgi:arsenate reductase
MNKIRVMFLCTGNSCRSQMAQGWAKHLASNLIESRSAGIEAHGQNKYAIKAMAEVGIDISDQNSISVNSEMLEWADLLITLCDNAEEQCPVLDPETSTLHLPLADPAKIKGTYQEIMNEFHYARDEVKNRVLFVIDQLYPELSAARA